ncbi:MAG: HAD-IIA family hydrolase [Pirellulales bacterium]|nr:HAD-IIA family hydrolase [Pirellulales bacterium]
MRHVALDLDGTIYKGNQPFSSSSHFLDLLDRLGIGFTFLTNNCSRSTADYVTHLGAMGIVTEEGRIYTSADATVDYLRRKHPTLQRLYLLGTPSLKRHFADAGFVVCSEDAADEPDAVVVGFDTTMTYDRLCRTAYWIAQGKPYFATHPDRVCPTNLSTLLVDCGAICEALHEATGRKPDCVPGKPNAQMLHGILSRHEVAAEELAMVGDRLYTDMEMARRSGALGVLVLTGETSAEEVDRAEPAPDLVVTGLDRFGDLLKEHRNGRQSGVQPHGRQSTTPAGR